MAICLGEGKNFDYIEKLNEELKIFSKVIPVAHPRFIMQYRRKTISTYRERYSEILLKALEKLKPT